MMKKGNERGFTLIELMVALAVFALSMAAATSALLPLTGHFAQESKSAETQMESILGLDIMRADIESAGYGLPLEVREIYDDNDNGLADFGDLVGYEGEAAVGEAANHNDWPNAPRPYALGNDAGPNESDWLVVRSLLVRPHDQAGRWTYIICDKNSKTQPPHVWQKLDATATPEDDGSRNIDPDPEGEKMRVIVTRMMGGSEPRLVLIGNSDKKIWNTFLKDIPETSFEPIEPLETYLVFAVGPDAALRGPFNRADYFLSTANVPQRCAPNTAVLMKAVLDHEDGTFRPYVPLFDCVADMQVVFGLDMDVDGTLDTYFDGKTMADADADQAGASLADVRQVLEKMVPGALEDPALLQRRHIKEVRVYVLAHEGQRDPRFTFNAETIDVGLSNFNIGHAGVSSAFNLKEKIGDPDYKYYRWRVYSMILKPENLRW